MNFQIFFVTTKFAFLSADSLNKSDTVRFIVAGPLGTLVEHLQDTERASNRRLIFVLPVNTRTNRKFPDKSRALFYRIFLKSKNITVLSKKCHKYGDISNGMYGNFVYMNKFVKILRFKVVNISSDQKRAYKKPASCFCFKKRIFN